MNELVKYYDNVLERLEEQTAVKIGVDNSKLIEAFKQLRELAIKEDKKEVNIEAEKRDIKDIMFEALNIKNVKDKNKRLKVAIGLYWLLDYKFENPNSLKALNEICHDLGMTKIEYIRTAVSMSVDYLNNGNPKKRN